MTGEKRSTFFFTSGGWFYLLSVLGAIHASFFLVSGQVFKHMYGFFMCEEMFLCLKINYTTAFHYKHGLYQNWLGEEETEGRFHHSQNFLARGRGGAGTSL